MHYIQPLQANICHRHKIQVRKEMKRFGTFIVFRVLARMPVDAQTNVSSSGMHEQWFSHWKIRGHDHDIVFMISQGSLML